MEMSELLLYVCCTVATTVATTPTDECNVLFHGVPHKQEIAFKKDFIEHPHSLAVDKNTNTLYFTYFNNQIRDPQSMKVNLDTKQFNIIEELHGVCSFAVDPDQGNVYAGCREVTSSSAGGLYQYDTNLEKFVPINEEKDISFVYFKDTLYYLKYESNILYTTTNGQDMKLYNANNLTLVGLVIDSDNDKIFLSDRGVYVQKSGSTEIVLYKDTENIRALAVDLNGNTYGCNFVENTISVFDKSSGTIRKVLHANYCHGLAFDSHNNLLYADWETFEITRLLKC